MKSPVLRLPDGLIDHVKMVFLDLDGTALDSNKQLTPGVLNALRLLRLRGIPYTFASARPAGMMALHCQKADVSLPVIACEGAEIRVWKTGSTIQQFPIAQSDAIALMEFCGSSGLDCTFYTPNTAYFSQNTHRIQRFRRYNEQAVAAGLPPVICQFLESNTPQFIASQQVLKVCVMPEDDASRAAVQNFLMRRPALRAEGSEDRLVSVTASTVSKAVCIRLLCQMQEIDLANVCCFGDYYNDIDMLKAAGCSVAMGNGPDAVRNAARYVTASNDEDGAALFIRKYICGE